MTQNKNWNVSWMIVNGTEIHECIMKNIDITTLTTQFASAHNITTYGNNILEENKKNIQDISPLCTEILFLCKTSHECLTSTWNSLQRQNCAFREGLKPLADEIVQCAVECQHGQMQIIYATLCV